MTAGNEYVLGENCIVGAGAHSTVLRPGSEPPMAAKLLACLDEVTAEERAMSEARGKS